jgi:hypothetical protein
VKKLAAMTALLGALVFSAVALAGNGGGHLNARLAKLDARVAKYAEKCHVVSPKAKCSAVKERLSARLAKIEARLDARIAKAQKPERKAKLQAARDHVASLLASL